MIRFLKIFVTNLLIIFGLLATIVLPLGLGSPYNVLIPLIGLIFWISFFIWYIES